MNDTNHTGEAGKTVFDKLNARQKSFVLEYIECRVATEAYTRAFSSSKKTVKYDTARANAPRLLADACVKAAISEKLNQIWGEKEQKIGAVFDELRALAFSDVRNVMDFSEDGTFRVKDLSTVDTRSIKKLKIRKEPSRKEGDSVIEGADIIEVELYDKRGALADLAEIVNMKKAAPAVGQMIIYLDRQDEKL